MKSLDEVIKDLQEQIDDDMNCEYSINWIIDKHDVEDAIHYMKELKEARDIIATAREEAKIQIEDFKSDIMNKIADNPPLTWDELMSMPGKAIWITFSNGKGWFVIHQCFEPEVVGEEAVMYCNDMFYFPKKYQGTKWQAYRKERE